MNFLVAPTMSLIKGVRRGLAILNSTRYLPLPANEIMAREQIEIIGVGNKFGIAVIFVNVSATCHRERSRGVTWYSRSLPRKGTVGSVCPICICELIMTLLSPD